MLTQSPVIKTYSGLSLHHGQHRGAPFLGSAWEGGCRAECRLDLCSFTRTDLTQFCYTVGDFLHTLSWHFPLIYHKFLTWKKNVTGETPIRVDEKNIFNVQSWFLKKHNASLSNMTRLLFCPALPPPLPTWPDHPAQCAMPLQLSQVF